MVIRNIVVAFLVASSSCSDAFTMARPSSSSSSVSSLSASTTPSASSTTTSSALDDVPMGPPDAILGIAQAFRACTDPRKVNVCVGAYRDETGKPWVLPSVRQAEQLMLSDASENKEYLPIEGDAEFISKALAFAYGSDAGTRPPHLAAVQTLSGTGACRIGAAFLARFFPKGTQIYVPVPTWGNHWSIMKDAGLDAVPYRYYSRATNALDWDGLLQDLDAGAPDGSIVLLHACAHNPTGCDPTQEQWKELAAVMKRKQHTVFFDSAYQGFASGDAERDAFSLRYFCQEGIPVMLAQSFAKNFGLYGERCGTFSIVCSSPEQRERIMSQLKLIVRPMYSSPPKHGSSIVRTVLGDEALTAQYYAECQSMAARIAAMRELLVETLAGTCRSEHDWSHVSNQIGMFAFTGMTADMVDRLTAEHAIFLTRDGRISLAGLNPSNVEYVARAIHDVTRGKPITDSDQ